MLETLVVAYVALSVFVLWQTVDSVDNWLVRRGYNPHPAYCILVGLAIGATFPWGPLLLLIALSEKEHEEKEED